MSNEKWRSRLVTFVLYPESQMDIVEKIRRSGVDYLLCSHYADKDESGCLKKLHIHFILRFSHARWNSAISKDFGIRVEALEQVRNLKNVSLYLIHFNEPDKFQYCCDEVQGSRGMLVLFRQYLSDDSKCEGEKVLEILDFIDSLSCIISFSSFVREVVKMGYYDIFRRNSYTFNLIFSDRLASLKKADCELVPF